MNTATRERLPAECTGITHHFEIAGFEGYIRASTYEDGRLGEIFIKMAKTGSYTSGLIDGFATAISIGLQHGIPLEIFASKFINTRFEPMGYTGNLEIRAATSILDYIFRWLLLRFGEKHVEVRSQDSNREAGSIQESHP